MAWSWSNTSVSYSDCLQNVYDKKRGWLEAVYAEWIAYDGGSVCFDEKKYKRALKRAKILPTDVLADYIWDRMCEQALCTNGGHYAYCCPFGCNLHLVSFDK